MFRESVKPYFPEPLIANECWAKTGETTLSWLKRSTVSRAIAARQFLNRSLALLPDVGRDQIYRKLLDDWNRGFFELVVGRLLQVAGSVIEIEPELPDGRHPDFIARFSTRTVVVEAIRPVTNEDAKDHEKQADALLQLIEKWIPSGWGLLVHELPDIKPHDSKARVQKLISNAFQNRTSSEDFQIDAEFDQGRVNITCTKRYGDNPKVHLRSGEAYWDDTQLRIQHAVKQKRKQVRSSPYPAIVAIDAGSFGASGFKDFDIALFGHTKSFVQTISNREIPLEFDASGVFCQNRDGQPTFSAALAFVGTGFALNTPPVLYLHPRFTGELPDELQVFETRRFVGGVQGIERIPEKVSGIMNQVGFVTV